MTTDPGTPTPTTATTSAPTTSGYADVDGLHLYFETYGPLDGEPLVLVHGGVLSIGLSWAALIPALVDRYRLVGVEVQGHGRTADVDRDLTTVEHAGLMLDLIPGSQLAVFPGTTHREVTRRVDLLAPVVRTFLG